MSDRPPTVTLPPRTAIPLTRAPDLEADKQRQYYHNHIVGACYVYLPQTAAHIRWGGRLRVANGYNTGHFRGTPIFRSLLIDLKDLPYYGVPEIASEAFDIPGAKAVLVVATGEGLVPRPFTMLSKEERYFLYLAKKARKAGTNKNTELAITVKPPHVGFHRPPSSVEEIPDSTAHGANLQPYGMPKGSYAFDILNTNSQPPMRFGCVAFVNRSRVFFIGGQLSYIDVEFPDTSALPPVVFDLSKIQWEIKNRGHDRIHDINNYVHASSCQSGRHSDSDEAVGYIWGGHNRRLLSHDTAGRTIPGGTTSTSEHANLSIQSKFEANTKLTMVWFPQADGLTFRKDDDKSQFMITEVLIMNPKSARPTPEPLDDEGRPVNYDTLAEQDLRKLQSFGFLVSNSRLQPPSYEQFKQMRENPRLRSFDAWDVLYLFHRNGQVWSLTLSSETVFNPDGLSWKLERHHWVLPFSLQPDDLEPERQKEIAAKTISDLDSVSLRIVGVVPRARFTHDLIPDDIYPTVQQPVPPQMCFNPFSNSGFGNNNIPFPTSGFSAQPPSGPAPRKRMLIAESDFVIVFEKLLRDRTRQHTVVAQSTTFIPKLGHCVNEYYRVRMPKGVSLQAVTVVTPHFLRPLPPPQIMIPLSDSRRVDQSNVDRQTNRIRELPTVRPFQGVVHGIRDDGINPEHGLPISTYLSRSPMTLKESVAHVAMRFFSEKQLLKMKEKSMPEASEVTIEKNEPQLFAATDLRQPLLNSKNLWHSEGGKQVKEFIETNAIYNKHDFKPDCLPLMLPDGITQAGKQTVLDIILNHIEKQEMASTEDRKTHAVVFVLSNFEKSQPTILETFQDRSGGAPLHERVARCTNAAFLFVSDRAHWQTLSGDNDVWNPVSIGKVSSVAVYNSQVFNIVKDLTKDVPKDLGGPPTTGIGNYANESHALVYDLIRKTVVEVIPITFLGGRLEKYLVR